jgi:hypothetical protein
MSRPGSSFTGFAPPLGAFLPFVLAAFPPARTNAQAVTPLTKSECVGGQGVRRVSVESHVIPAKRVLREGGGAGIQFLPDMDPRFRGGDVLTFICMGGPLAHDHSLGSGE